MNNQPSVDDLLKWRDRVIEDIEKNKADLAEAQKRLLESQERLGLIEKLLKLDGKKFSERDIADNPKDLLDECEKILREAGRPLHVKKIHSELLSRGVPVPGKGTEANVISRMQRSGGRFIRTGRGTYGIPEFGISEAKPKKRKLKSVGR